MNERDVIYGSSVAYSPTFLGCLEFICESTTPYPKAFLISYLDVRMPGPAPTVL